MVLDLATQSKATQRPSFLMLASQPRCDMLTAHLPPNFCRGKKKETNRKQFAGNEHSAMEMMAGRRTEIQP